MLFGSLMVYEDSFGIIPVKATVIGLCIFDFGTERRGREIFVLLRPVVNEAFVVFLSRFRQMPR
jgi:hypothetical protein